MREVDDVQRGEGYRLVGSFEPERDAAAAVAGFRAGHSLAWGHFIYLDDLSTDRDARRRGHAGALLDWLVEGAQRLGCDQLHLDSGVGYERSDAHRLYLNAGMVISAPPFRASLGLARLGRTSGQARADKRNCSSWSAKPGAAATKWPAPGAMIR